MAMIDPHDNDFGLICTCAVRYSLGRMTYMPTVVQDFIRPHLTEVTDRTLRLLRNDIEDHGAMGLSYGEDFDKANWMEFLDDIKKEIERRKTEDE